MWFGFQMKVCISLLVLLVLFQFNTALISKSTITESCEDNSTRCGALFLSSACRGSFRNWAYENCRKFCGFCTPKQQSTISLATNNHRAIGNSVTPTVHVHCGLCSRFNPQMLCQSQTNFVKICVKYCGWQCP